LLRPNRRIHFSRSYPFNFFFCPFIFLPIFPLDRADEENGQKNVRAEKWIDLTPDSESQATSALLHLNIRVDGLQFRASVA
jgi:hypothetical protein